MYRSLTSTVLVLLFAIMGCQDKNSNSDECCHAGGTLMDTFIQKGDHCIDPSCTIDCIVVSHDGLPGTQEHRQDLQLYVVRRTYWKSLNDAERVRAQKDYKALGFAQFKDGDAVDLVTFRSYEHATGHRCTAFIVFSKN